MSQYVISTTKRLPSAVVLTSLPQVQLQQAREKAGEFDDSYRSLAARLEEKEATLRAQEPIHSEVEVVKRQLEENKVKKPLHIGNSESVLVNNDSVASDKTGYKH